MTQVETYADGASTSDAELITAVRGGDYSAFGALYERHAVAARTVARQYVHSSSDADDVVSEAFAKVLGILQAGGGPDVTFRAYLFTVVRRLSYDLVNGVRRTQPTDDVETFETAFGPMASTEDPTLQGFERSIVTKAYQGLPERWQAVLWYTEVEEMNPAQIAPLLGLSANGVSALAYRAREGLRQAYLQQHLTGAASEGCEVVNPLLGSYVRGGLAKRENAKVDAHLDDCGECRGLVLELGDVSHGMRAVIAPLVLGVAGLGLVGHTLPIVGGGAVAGGVTGAGTGTGASAGASGTAAGTSGGAVAGGSGAVGAGGGAAATAGAAGGTAAGGAGAAAAAGATGAVAAGSGAAVAGATGLAAFIAASPLVAAAVGVVAIAAVGAGVVALSGGFSSDTPPSAGASPDPSTSPSDTPSGTPSTEPPVPTGDPTSPTNLGPLEGEDAGSTPGGTTGGGADGGTGGDAAGSAGGGQASPGATIPTTPLTPVDPADPADPADPVAPAPASLDLTFAPLQLAPRDPEDLTLTASNTGGTSAQEVVVDVTLPANVSVASSTVVAGRGVVPVLKTAALPCGAAVPQADGTSLVNCSIGVLAPGATKELVVTVQASRGGTYSFGGTVRGKGLAPVKKTYAPSPVQAYGAEVDLASPTVGDVLNPGASAVRLTARNTGDVDAHGLTFSVGNLPSGSSARALTPGWSCAPTGSSARCSVAGAGGLPAPDASASAGPAVVLDVQLVADGEAAASTTGLTFAASASSGGQSVQDSASATLRVGSPWAGAEDAIPSGAGAIPQCVGVGASTASIALAGVTNTTAYDDLRVRLDAVGSASPMVSLARGTATDLRLDDGYRFPEGTATLTLATTVAGAEYTREVEAGAFEALDCYRVPDGDWLASATVATENVGGTVRLTGSATNTSTTPLDVRMLAPERLGDVADSRMVTLAPGATGTFTIDTGRTQVAAGKVEFHQSRWVEDVGPGEEEPPSDGKEYTHTTTAELARAVIAPVVSRPSLGGCTFDLATRSSVFDVVFVFDNSSSTLPVVFGVVGRDELRTEVGAGEKVSVTASGLVRGLAAHDVSVLTDGRSAGSFTVQGESCYVPAWSQEFSVAAQNVGGAVRLVGSLTNTTAEAMDVRMLAPDGLGDVADSEKVTLAPGATGSFTIDTGRAQVAAGEVTFRQDRHVVETGSAGKDYSHKGTVELARAVIAPVVSRPSLGECTFDLATRSSVFDVVFVFDNSSSTLPVVFGVVGRDELRTEVGAGEKVSVTASGLVRGLAAHDVSVLTDGRSAGSFTVQGESCYVPAWSQEFSVAAQNVGGAVRLVGSLTNTTAEAMDVRMLAPDGLGDVADSEKVTLAPGATGSFTIDTGRAQVAAGEVTFRQYRWVSEVGAPGKGFTQNRSAPFGDVSIVPASPAPAVGQCVFDPDTHSSSVPVTLTFDNSASTLPVPFTVTGREDLARTVAAGRTEKVTTSVGPAGATFTVLADGARLASHTVPGVSCYVPDWTVKASASSAVADRTVHLTARLTNFSNESMQVAMVTPYGTAGAQVVEPGATATFTQDTGKSEVPAGKVELRQSRTVDGKEYTSTATAGYEAARYVPVVVAPAVGAPTVGACWFEDNEQRSYQPVTFVYDNTASTQAVTFHIEGSAAVVRDSTRTVQPGTSIQVKAPDAGEAGATYRVVTDTGTSWTFQVAGKTCLPAWQYGQFYAKGDRVVSHGTNYVATVSHLSLFTPHTFLGSATWDAE